jgi:hypothetical protein
MNTAKARDRDIGKAKPIGRRSEIAMIADIARP